MLPLGFIIFPYLIILLKKITIQKKIYDYFYSGFFYGFGFLLVFLSWIQNPFFTNDTIKNYAIISLFLPIFLSLFFGIGFIFFKYINKIYYLIIFTPFIFVSIEFVISNLFYGFPWVTFSLILSNSLYLDDFSLSVSVSESESEILPDQEVDGVDLLVFDFRSDDGLEGPVVCPLGPAGNPFLEQSDFLEA